MAPIAYWICSRKLSGLRSTINSMPAIDVSWIWMKSFTRSLLNALWKSLRYRRKRVLLDEVRTRVLFQPTLKEAVNKKAQIGQFPKTGPLQFLRETHNGSIRVNH